MSKINDLTEGSARRLNFYKVHYSDFLSNGTLLFSSVFLNGEYKNFLTTESKIIVEVINKEFNGLFGEYLVQPSGRSVLLSNQVNLEYESLDEFCIEVTKDDDGYISISLSPISILLIDLITATLFTEKKVDLNNIWDCDFFDLLNKILKIDKISSLAMVESLGLLSMETSNESCRENWKKFTNFGLIFLIAHELGHFITGHLDFVNSRYDQNPDISSDIIPPYKKFREGAELIADSYATFKLCLCIVNSYDEEGIISNEDQAYKFVEDIIQSFFSIVVLWHASDTRNNNYNFENDYPPSLTRHFGILTTLDRFIFQPNEDEDIKHFSNDVMFNILHKEAYSKLRSYFQHESSQVNLLNIYLNSFKYFTNHLRTYSFISNNSILNSWEKKVDDFTILNHLVIGRLGLPLTSINLKNIKNLHSKIMMANHLSWFSLMSYMHEHFQTYNFANSHSKIIEFTLKNGDNLVKVPDVACTMLINWLDDFYAKNQNIPEKELNKLKIISQARRLSELAVIWHYKHGGDITFT